MLSCKNCYPLDPPLLFIKKSKYLLVLTLESLLTRPYFHPSKIKRDIVSCASSSLKKTQALVARLWAANWQTESWLQRAWQSSWSAILDNVCEVLFPIIRLWTRCRDAIFVEQLLSFLILITCPWHVCNTNNNIIFETSNILLSRPTKYLDFFSIE